MEGEAPAVAAPAETPNPAGESAAPESTGESTTTPETASTKSENRFQKLATENKRMREELATLQSQMGGLDGAKNLDSWLRKDPKNLRFVMDLMEGKPPSQGKDPYEAFAPEVAERFRKLDAIERRLADEDQQRKEAETRSVEENKTHLESIYMNKLKADGFINKDGSFDENEVDLLSDAVLSRATRTAKNPYKITEQELLTAYDQIIKGTKAFEKRGLKNTVKPTPPLSGSNKGSIPNGKSKQTDEDRWAQMARDLE